MKNILILMSTYNGSKNINKQLESICNQTLISNIKIVIRDDGSTDDTVDIINSWKDKLNIKLYVEYNIGPAKSFWKLLLLAGEADFYAFCDQDDYWLGNKMEVAVKSLEKRLGSALYFSNAEFTNDNLELLGTRVYKKPPIITLPRIMAVNCALGCTIVFNKVAYHNMVKANLNTIRMHDKTALLITYLTGDVIYDNEPRMLYRQHQGNVVGRKNKNMRKRLSQTMKQLNDSKKNSIAFQADDLLNNFGDVLNEENKKYLYYFSTYRDNIGSKGRLLFDTKTNTGYWRLTLSFKLKILFKFA